MFVAVAVVVVVLRDQGRVFDRVFFGRAGQGCTVHLSCPSKLLLGTIHPFLIYWSGHISSQCQNDSRWYMMSDAFPRRDLVADANLVLAGIQVKLLHIPTHVEDHYITLRMQMSQHFSQPFLDNTTPVNRRSTGVKDTFISFHLYFLCKTQ